MSPNWFLNMSSPVLEVPITQFFFSVLIGKYYLISNGNRTEWGPIWSVIIRVINKICLIQAWLQTKLDDTKFCYQFIMTLTKFLLYKALF